MTDATDAVETAEIEAQPLETAQATPEGAESSDQRAEETTSLKTDSDSQTEKDSGWYEKELIKRNAEGKRKKEKIRELTEKLERANAKLEEATQAKPTRESVEDEDEYQARLAEHAASVAVAKSRAEDIQWEVERDTQQTESNELTNANEVYKQNVESYLAKPDAVSPQAFLAKQQVVNDALLERSPVQQAEIISELNSLGAESANVLMNIADNPEARYILATGSLREALSVIDKCKEVKKKTSDAPAPVPELGGTASKVSGDYDLSTFEGIQAYKKAHGLR